MITKNVTPGCSNPNCTCGENCACGENCTCGSESASKATT